MDNTLIMSSYCNYNFNNVGVMDNIFSENTYIVAERESMPFTFHYVRQLSDEINDSVLKINIWHNGTLNEYFVNNLVSKVDVTGIEIIDQATEKMTRFVLGGDATSLYINDRFAIIE